MGWSFGFVAGAPRLGLADFACKRTLYSVINDDCNDRLTIAVWMVSLIGKSSFVQQVQDH